MNRYVVFLLLQRPRPFVDCAIDKQSMADVFIFAALATALFTAAFMLAKSPLQHFLLLVQIALTIHASRDFRALHNKADLFIFGSACNSLPYDGHRDPP